MRAIVTTVVRESVYGRQATGHIYDVDLGGGTVTHQLAVPPPARPASDDNPRGGIRGGRGVALTPEGPVVATYDTLVRYDESWEITDVVESPLLAGVHEIDWDGRRIWASATAIDAVVQVDESGLVSLAWDPHGASASTFGLTRRFAAVFDRCMLENRPLERVDHCHINGVTRRGEDLVIHFGLVRETGSARARTLRRLGLGAGAHTMVVAVGASGQARVLLRLPGGTVPTHNGQFIDDDTIAVNDSATNTLRFFEASGGAEVRRVRMPGEWLRGLEPIEESHVLVGTAPATIHVVDRLTGAIDERIELSTNPNEAVHGLTAR